MKSEPIPPNCNLISNILNHQHSPESITFPCLTNTFYDITFLSSSVLCFFFLIRRWTFDLPREMLLCSPPKGDFTGVFDPPEADKCLLAFGELDVYLSPSVLRPLYPVKFTNVTSVAYFTGVPSVLCLLSSLIPQSQNSPILSPNSNFFLST